MKLPLRNLLIVSALVTCSHSLWGQQAEEGGEKTTESPSPDRKFAFRYSGDSDSEDQTYNLIDKRSGKVLKTVAKADPDLGASARFHIRGVLWRADSKAFAVTATLIRLGSSVLVFVQDGSVFREIKLPDLDTEVPKKEKHGMDLEHVAELDSGTAIRWEKDGSLVMQIETTVDGSDGSVTATRTVVLAFNRAGKAKIQNSTIKFSLEKQ
jgi:hypothetical protein